MSIKKLFSDILDNFENITNVKSTANELLWQDFLKVHPADIAQFLTKIDKEKSKKLFTIIPKKIRAEVFAYLSESGKVNFLSILSNQEKREILSTLPLDDLTDLFDYFSDQELKDYIKLLHKKDREKVISLMKFDPDSAGGLMHTDVLTLMQDFTIEKSIKILQRLQPRKELHSIIYLTNLENELVGQIKLEDLVLKKPHIKLTSIIKPAELVINVNETKEKIASNMSKYKLDISPVISDNNIFLGVIDSEALVDIIEQKAAEEVYKISALPPIKQTYFDTPFFKLFSKRLPILTILLLTQTFSTIILGKYESMLGDFFGLYLTMIASTGGNASGQTSVLVIQGLSSGEISDGNIFRFLKREFLMACAIGITLALITFARVFIFDPEPSKLLHVFTVSASIAAIVIFSVVLGSIIPIILKKLKFDPAFSAGPFLATLMDIFGLLIYCNLIKFILFT